MIDDIEALGAIAQSANIGLHVDNCLGMCRDVLVVSGCVVLCCVVLCKIRLAHHIASHTGGILLTHMAKAGLLSKKFDFQVIHACVSFLSIMY